MNALKKNLRLRIFLCGFLLAVLPFGCGSDVDDREQIQAAYGEPDEMLQGGGGPYWFEVWYYDEKGVGYEFRRSAPRCGGGHDFYLSGTFRYDPATRRPGEIKVSAETSVGASKRSLVGP